MLCYVFVWCLLCVLFVGSVLEWFVVVCWCCLLVILFGVGVLFVDVFVMFECMVGYLVFVYVIVYIVVCVLCGVCLVDVMYLVGCFLDDVV